MDERAVKIVYDYIVDSIFRTGEIPNFAVFIVWKAKVLQNWDYIIGTDLGDGMIYELTFNGDKDEWYFDAYQKVENKVIKLEV